MTFFNDFSVSNVTSRYRLTVYVHANGLLLSVVLFIRLYVYCTLFLFSIFLSVQFHNKYTPCPEKKATDISA